MASATRAAKRAVLNALRRLGPARRSAIAGDMGGEWSEPSSQEKLRQMLGRMERAGLLVRTATGQYSLSPNWRFRGIDVVDTTETAIAEFLRQRGGIARTGEIHDAAGDRGVGGTERGYGHRRVTLTLKRSPRFRQDFGRGLWNLSDEERAQVPLVGYWAAKVIEAEADGENVGEAETKIIEFFEAVGSAFAEARNIIDLGEVARLPGLGDMLRAMADAAPISRILAVAAITAEVAEEAETNGQVDGATMHERLVDRKATDLPMHIYAAFENGDVELHRAAPPEFYWACSQAFGCCPARLSRGQVVFGATDALNDTGSDTSKDEGREVGIVLHHK